MFFRLLAAVSDAIEKLLFRRIFVCVPLRLLWREKVRRRRGKSRKFIVLELSTYGSGYDTFHFGVGFRLLLLLLALSMALSYEGIKWMEGGTLLSSSMLLTPKITP
jgi:hypothetical protein